MAEKTITQLTAIDALATGDEFAVYDASGTNTKKATAAQVKDFATNVDINGLTSASPATGDSVAIYDASASANRKATISDILALGGGGALDINGLTAVDTLNTADSVPIYDASASANRKTTIAGIKALATDVDINGLTSASPATGDSVVIYDASASGNRKTTLTDVKALMTDVDINGLTSASPATGDSLVIYDTSASANRKATISDVLALGGGGGGGLDINGLTGGTPESSDTVPIYDVSEGANKKVTLLQVAGIIQSVANSPIDALASDDRLVFRDTSTGLGKYATVATLDTRWGSSSDTWTPVLAFGGASVGITYGTQIGQYVRTGNLIHFSINIVLTSKGSSTGSASITLPFAAAAGAQWRLTSFATISAGDIEMATVAGGASVVSLAKRTVSTGVGAAMTNADLTNTSTLLITGFYECAP